jgi:hypothetical protein
MLAQAVNHWIGSWTRYLLLFCAAAQSPADKRTKSHSRRKAAAPRDAEQNGTPNADADREEKTVKPQCVAAQPTSLTTADNALWRSVPPPVL